MGTKEVTLNYLGAGSESAHRIELLPGMTVGEALTLADLDPKETHLQVPGSGRLFDSREDLYQAVDPGEELRCTPAMDAGVLEILAVVGLAVTAVAVYWHVCRDGCAPSLERVGRSLGGGLVPPASSSQERLNRAVDASDARWLRRNGWVVRGEGIEGRFRTPTATFPGRVEFADGGWQVYFQFPASWIISGKHEICWTLQPDGWWWVHQNRLQENVVAAISAAESFVLEKAAERRRSA